MNKPNPTIALYIPFDGGFYVKDEEELSILVTELLKDTCLNLEEIEIELQEGTPPFLMNYSTNTRIEILPNQIEKARRLLRYVVFEPIKFKPYSVWAKLLGDDNISSTWVITKYRGLRLRIAKFSVPSFTSMQLTGAEAAIGVKMLFEVRSDD